MRNDIRFYDLDLNLVHILPQNAPDCGYTSCNTTTEHNGDGAVEIVFRDSELKKKIEAYRGNLIVVWNDFQGFIPCYNFDSSDRVVGMHLNGLLHRAVIPDVTEQTGDVETIARKIISQYVPWLTLPEKIVGFSNTVTYCPEKYQTADVYIQTLFNLDHAGYRITADVKNKKFVFACIKQREIPLLLSEGRKNAYDFKISFNGKEEAFGGWYQQKQEDGDPVWTYLSLDNTKAGIYMVDTVLNATTEAEAMTELKQHRAEYEMSVTTRNIRYCVDYQLGDVLKVQKDGVTVKKLVSGVNQWNEKEYGEQPILTEVEENE